MRSENEVPTRAKQTTNLLLLPAIRYGLYIFPLNIQNSRSKLNAWSLEKAFTAHRRMRKGTLWWFYSAYNDAFMGSKISLRSHMLAACARDASDMCDDFPPGCHKHLSLRFFMASYRTPMEVQRYMCRCRYHRVTPVHRSISFVLWISRMSVNGERRVVTFPCEIQSIISSHVLENCVWSVFKCRRRRETREPASSLFNLFFAIQWAAASSHITHYTHNNN